MCSILRSKGRRNRWISFLRSFLLVVVTLGIVPNRHAPLSSTTLTIGRKGFSHVGVPFGFFASAVNPEDLCGGTMQSGGPCGTQEGRLRLEPVRELRSAHTTTRETSRSKDPNKKDNVDVDDIVRRSRILRHSLQRPLKPFPPPPWDLMSKMRSDLARLSNVSGLVDCLYRDMKSSTPSVQWLIHTFDVLKSAKRALTNATSGVRSSRRNLRDLHVWSPGHCDDDDVSKRENWCAVVSRMIDGGGRLIGNVRGELAAANGLIVRNLATNASNILDRENRLYAFLSDPGLAGKVGNALRRLQDVAARLGRCLEKGATQWVGWKVLQTPVRKFGVVQTNLTVSTMIAADPALRGDAVPFDASKKEDVGEHDDKGRSLSSDVARNGARTIDLATAIAHMANDLSRIRSGIVNYHWIDVTDNVDDADPCSEQSLRDAVDALWSDVRSWASKGVSIAAESAKLCKTAKIRALDRKDEVKYENIMLDRAATIESVASRYVARAKDVLGKLWVEASGHREDATPKAQCAGNGEGGGACAACATCGECMRDEWCGWCDSIDRCLDGDESGVVLGHLQESCPIDSWRHRNALVPRNRVCPNERVTKPLPKRAAPTQDDVLHYIAPEDLAMLGGRRVVHNTLTTWNRAMECERRRLEELNRRSENGQYWTYSDSKTTWFEHNYTGIPEVSDSDEGDGGSATNEPTSVTTSPPPYCDDSLLARDIALAKSAYGLYTPDADDLRPPVPTNRPKQASEDEIEVEERAMRDLNIRRAVRAAKGRSKERRETNGREGGEDGKILSSEVTATANEEKQREDAKDEEARRRGSDRSDSATADQNQETASSDAYTTDLTANDDEDEDPNHVLVTKSSGEFEKLSQARMYCELNFDRLCTKKDLIKAYGQKFRSCSFAWFDAEDSYVTIGNHASGGVGGKDIAMCGSCGEAKSTKDSQRAEYMAKYPGRMVSNTMPDADSDTCESGGMLITNRPQIEPAFCCGAPKNLSPEKFWAKASCHGKEHELCSMDPRCCWYQPEMWRERLGEGSSCQDKDACALDDLSLEDPAVVAKAQEAKKKKKQCSRQFPFNISMVRCDGMERVRNIENASMCENACCRDMKCGAWQWCEANAACSPANTCWKGPSADNCTFAKTVLRASSDSGVADVERARVRKAIPPVRRAAAMLRRGGADRVVGAPVTGDLSNMNCDGLGLAKRTERPIGLGMFAPIQYASDCETACTDDIGCGAWLWCDNKLTLENMETHCKPLGSCKTGRGPGFRGRRNESSCRNQPGLSGKTYFVSGIVGGALKPPSNMSSERSESAASNRSSTSNEEKKRTMNASSVSSEARSKMPLDTLEKRVQRAITSTLQEVLDDFNPLEAGPSTLDDDDFDVLNGDSDAESEDEERRFRDAFCAKLAKTQTTNKTATKLSPDVMENLRQSCSSVRCVDLMEYCSAKFQGKDVDDGHDTGDGQWQWHHGMSR